MKRTKGVEHLSYMRNKGWQYGYYTTLTNAPQEGRKFSLRVHALNHSRALAGDLNESWRESKAIYAFEQGYLKGIRS